MLIRHNKRKKYYFVLNLTAVKNMTELKLKRITTINEEIIEILTQTFCAYKTTQFFKLS